MERIFEKQFLLTGFLEYLIKIYFSKTNSSHSDENKSDLTVDIVTPDNTKERGSQLSLLFSQDLKAVHEKVEKMGVVVSTGDIYYNIKQRFKILTPEIGYNIFISTYYDS